MCQNLFPRRYNLDHQCCTWSRPYEFEDNPMLFPYAKGYLNHDKKCGKTQSGNGVCILTRKESKIYNIYGPEGS